MSFNDRKKKRIKDIAVIIKNSKKMSIEMNSINGEYEQELIEVVDSILSLKEPEKEEKQSPLNRPKRNKKPFRSKLFKKGIVPYKGKAPKASKSKNQEIPDPYQSKKSMPDWSKDLWRKIMIKCHPDKLIHEKDLSNEDLVERSQIIELASNSIESEDWNNLIYLAALIDSFTEKLKFNQQINQLNQINQKNSKLIMEIQNSLAWHWGISWSAPSKRMRILKHVLQMKNIKLPPDEALRKIVDNLE